MGARSKKVDDVAYGPYDDIVRGKWGRGQQIADEITRRKFDYKGDDPSYEIVGGSGGQIQNSNSVAYTFGKGMDLDLDSAVRAAGIERRFPGWGATSSIQATTAMSRRRSSQPKTDSRHASNATSDWWIAPVFSQ